MADLWRHYVEAWSLLRRVCCERLRWAGRTSTGQAAFAGQGVVPAFEAGGLQWSKDYNVLKFCCFKIHVFRVLMGQKKQS